MCHQPFSRASRASWTSASAAAPGDAVELQEFEDVTRAGGDLGGLDADTVWLIRVDQAEAAMRPFAQIIIRRQFGPLAQPGLTSDLADLAAGGAALVAYLQDNLDPQRYGRHLG